jgi:opacity protein-like surface antigen
MMSRPRVFIFLTMALATRVLVAAPARAEGDAGGFATPATAGPTGFGALGQYVISMGATTDEHLFIHGESGGAWQLQLSPALDYFIAPRVSVGGVVGYRHASGGGGGTNSDGSNRFTLGARAGYDLDINDRFGFWPMAGLYFDRASANHNSVTNTWVGVYAPVLFHVAPHFFAGLGPSLQLNLSGPNGNEFGVDSLIGGWF